MKTTTAALPRPHARDTLGNMDTGLEETCCQDHCFHQAVDLLGVPGPGVRVHVRLRYRQKCEVSFLPAQSH